MAVQIEERKEIFPPEPSSAGVPPRRRIGIGSGFFDNFDQRGNNRPPILPPEASKKDESPKKPEPLSLQEYIGAILPDTPVDITIARGIKRIYRWIVS